MIAVYIIIAFVFIFQTEPAVAAPVTTKDVLCAQYGSATVAVTNAVHAKKCGLSGPRWNSTANEHRAWCMRVSETERNFEHDQRAIGVNCCNYGVEAVAMVREANILGCGFTGPRWSPDIPAHTLWCVGAAANFMQDERTARFAQFQACQQKKRP